MGSRIKTILDDAIVLAAVTKLIHRRGEFLWPKAMKFSVRTHADLPEFNRRMDQIAPEEVKMAVKMVVENGLGMYRTDIPSAVCSLLGFGRTSEEMRQHVDSLIGQMITDNQLKWRADYLISS
jgi:hypothetical protein